MTRRQLIWRQPRRWCLDAIKVSDDLRDMPDGEILRLKTSGRWRSRHTEVPPPPKIGTLVFEVAEDSKGRPCVYAWVYVIAPQNGMLTERLWRVGATHFYGSDWHDILDERERRIESLRQPEGSGNAFELPDIFRT